MFKLSAGKPEEQAGELAKLPGGFECQGTGGHHLIRIRLVDKREEPEIPVFAVIDHTALIQGRDGFYKEVAGKMPVQVSRQEVEVFSDECGLSEDMVVYALENIFLAVVTDLPGIIDKPGAEGLDC